MPKLKLTWNQLARLTELTEQEMLALKQYPCDDPQELIKLTRLRDSLYRQITINQKKAGI